MKPDGRTLLLTVCSVMRSRGFQPEFQHLVPVKQLYHKVVSTDIYLPKLHFELSKLTFS